MTRCSLPLTTGFTARLRGLETDLLSADLIASIIMSTRLVFRIIYRSVYTLLCFILLVLILVTPGDAIRQALPKQAYHIVIISAAYIGTVLVVGFIYAARLFVNRSILSSIPKSWIPIEKGDVNKQVRKMIAASLSRSAAIAFESRPRDTSTIMPVDVEPEYEEKVKENGHTKPHKKSLHMLRLKKTATMEDELGITLPPHKAVWGEIEHFGWASPNSPDLPNLQYSTVISELPNLIEAKALTLAPPDPESLADPPLLDREAVALLQRPESMGLRGYLTHLAELGVLTASPAVSDFVCMYEYARYSTRPISIARFRELMHLFAEVLRGMESLDPAILNPVDEDDASLESDIDDNAPLQTNPGTPRSKRSQHSLRSQHSFPSETGSSNSSGSQIRRRPPMAARNSSQNTWAQYRTAPTTPRSKRTAISRTSSANSFAQTRHPYPASASSSSSTHSGSGGSVIRLADRAGPGELPYVLRLTDTYDDQPLG